MVMSSVCESQIPWKSIRFLITPKVGKGIDGLWIMGTVEINVDLEKVSYSMECINILDLNYKLLQPLGGIR